MGRPQLDRDRSLAPSYRLAGRTLFPVDAKSVGIRFDTAYQGRYFEPFYIILQIDERVRCRCGQWAESVSDTL